MALSPKAQPGRVRLALPRRLRAPEACASCGSLEACDCRVYLAAYGIPVLPLDARPASQSFPFYPVEQEEGGRCN